MEQVAKQHLGLRADVRYRIELGFAFVDDGDRLFKMNRSVFECALGLGTRSPEMQAQAVALAESHKTVFARFATQEEAAASLADKEI